jgi:serine-type D-Ala-D-Ala carboxypeptidase/endopeptidase (penicillin-binding protein 4)
MQLLRLQLFIIPLVTTFLSTALWGQSTPPSVYASYFLENAISRLSTDTALKHGQVGICVVDLKTGEILGSHNATMSLIPASNMKIVTTAAGLSILGNDYRFRTELQYDGYIKDSALYGNIIIKGYGDPTLGSPLMEGVPSMNQILDNFTLKIKELGIKTIYGKIIGDGTAFERATATQTWLWEDLGNYYGSGPSGLNFNENLYELSFLQSPSVGSAPSVSSISPEVPHFKLYNEVISASGGGDDAYIYSAPYSQVGIVRGAIPSGRGIFSINGSLPDPPLFAAWHLRKNLMNKGIPVYDTATTQLDIEYKGLPNPIRTTFYTWYSPSLSTIVKRTNLESVNLYTEAILRAVALQQTGVGSNDKGVEIIKKFWQSKGVDIEGFFMQDGSGLSPRNGITPFQLIGMLRAIAADSEWFTHFNNSLPEAGKSGTMKRMFRQYPSVMGRLRAKSGTISRVRSYSGYVNSESGRELAFSVITNNFTCSQRDIGKKLEQFMSDLCKL